MKWISFLFFFFLCFSARADRETDAIDAELKPKATSISDYQNDRNTIVEGGVASKIPKGGHGINTCEEVNTVFDPPADGKKRPSFPICDQGSTFKCTVCVATDILSERAGFPVSALDVLMNYDGYSKAINLNQAGDSTQELSQTILASAGKKGVCPEALLPSADNYFVGRASANGSPITVSKIEDYVAELKALRKLSIAYDVITAKDSDITNDEACSAFERAKKLFPAISSKKLIQILSNTSTDGFVDWLSYLSCESIKKPDESSKPEPAPKLIYISRNPMQGLNDRFDEELRTRKPDELSKSMAVILDKDKFSSLLNGFHLDANHVVSVVGRHKDANGICQYTLRNSWGRSCDYYDSKRINCDRATGNISIPESFLQGAIRGVEYLDQGKP